jgi:hypothetical protein
MQSVESRLTVSRHIYHLHLQSWINWLATCFHAGVLLSLFDPEDWSNTLKLQKFSITSISEYMSNIKTEMYGKSFKLWVNIPVQCTSGKKFLKMNVKPIYQLGIVKQFE